MGGGGFDVSEAVAVISGLTAAITLIGGAKLLPAATAVGMKWLKGAIFG